MAVGGSGSGVAVGGSGSGSGAVGSDTDPECQSDTPWALRARTLAK